MAVELENEDRIISDFLKSIGPWRKHIVIGGGYAPIVYKLYLAGKEMGSPPVGTHDLDSLIPRKVPDASKKDIAKHLTEAGFRQMFKDREAPATEAYVKEVAGVEVEIEFLTDDATRGDKERNVPIAGVVAQPLPYLKLSLQRTVKFKTFSGEAGRVVSPGAWMFHKGLTFVRRKPGESKRYKDLYGLWYVGTQLGMLSKRAIDEVRTIGRDHARWFTTFRCNLTEWSREASPSEWSKLEVQDPFGKLRRLNFESLLETLFS